MASINVQGQLISSTGLTKASIENFFLNTNAPNSQLLAAIAVNHQAETSLVNGTNPAPMYIPIFDNTSGLTIAITAINFVQLYQAGQASGSGNAAVFTGTAAATATANWALASQQTPKPSVAGGANPWPAPGTGPLFSTGILTSGPTAFGTLVTPADLVNVGNTGTGTFKFGDRNFNTDTFTNAAVGVSAQNLLLPNQTLYLVSNTGGTVSANLTVTEQYKVFVQAMYLPL